MYISYNKTLKDVKSIKVNIEQEVSDLVPLVIYR